MHLTKRRVALLSILALSQPISAFSPFQREHKKLDRGLRIEVTAREGGQPVSEADVFVAYVPDPGAARKRMEVDLKTDARGIARVEGIPAGKIIVKVSASGFRSFARWYGRTEEDQTIQVQLEKHLRWEDKPKKKSS